AVFVILLVLTGSASAVPLEVTGGTIIVDSSGGFFEPVVSIHGNDWAFANVLAPGTICPCADPLTHPVTVPLLGLTTFILGGIHLADNEFEFNVVVTNTNPLITVIVPYGSHTLLRHPSSPPPPPFAGNPFDRPFTMTGHIDLHGSLDFVGQGIFHAELVPDPAGPSFPRFTYTFTAPEPPTMLLLLVGGVALGLRKVRHSG